MKTKKIILIFLLAIITINSSIFFFQPIQAEQIPNPDIDQVLEEFPKDVTESWKEAETIWKQMYNVIISVWNQQIRWRVQPIWDRVSNQIENWIERQFNTLRKAFVDEKEKTEKVIREKTEETKKKDVKFRVATF